MSLAIVKTRAKLGINAPSVTVEAHLSNGLPGLSIVGLPETAVKESKDRVRSALLNSHFDFPARRITINLAPADLPKEGGRYDLPIALGILAASEQIPMDSLADSEFIGELALSGELRRVDGILPASIACGEFGQQLFVPPDNAAEAALCKRTQVFAPANLLQLCAHLHRRQQLDPIAPSAAPDTAQPRYDLQDIKGQTQARRALEIAAAGGHNLLFFGPPGAGKTLLASRLAGILPPASEQESLEIAAVYSLINKSAPAFFSRPYRNPHHSASAAALVGGGSNPKPGEISLAHRGVLFLDELPEFSRKVLEVLREPIESGEIIISRASAQVRYPAQFQLVAAMNPCPCGYASNNDGRCRCTPDQIRRYRDKLSGPLLDRIDMHVHVRAISHNELQQASSGENSQTVQERVARARTIQQDRQGHANCLLDIQALEVFCQLQQEDRLWLHQAIEKLGLSARAYHRTLRVARTLADLAASPDINTIHLREALGYRQLDRPLQY